MLTMRLEQRSSGWPTVNFLTMSVRKMPVLNSLFSTAVGSENPGVEVCSVIADVVSMPYLCW